VGRLLWTLAISAVSFSAISLPTFIAPLIAKATSPLLHPSAPRGENGMFVFGIETGADDPSGRSFGTGPIEVSPVRGRPLTKLFSDSGTEPVWSPDGRTIAYDGGMGLLRMNADGSGQRLISGRSVADPSWSGDGRQIVAFDENANPIGLIVINADGTHPRRILPPGLAAVDTAPKWSPDSEWIAFAGSDDKLHLIRPNGTDLRTFTTAPYIVFNNLVWSPDSRSLLFSAATYPPVRYALGTVSPPSGRVRTTPDPHPYMTSNIVWSPDGQQLAWATGATLNFESLRTGRLTHVRTPLPASEAINWIDWQAHPKPSS
jgi:Tol biopolymer transport system component